MSIENSFLKKLIETKDWDTVLDKDIDISYFSGANKRAFKWISDFKIKYGELPDKETFKKRFPEITLDIEAPETVGYYCDELRQKIKHNKLVAALEKVDTLINDREVDKCYNLLEDLITEVNSEFTLKESIDLGSNTEKRYQDYLVSKASGGMTGIPLGIYPIDKQTGGVKEVDLLAFLAKSGTGKAVTLDTPILTMNGWKPMRDITYSDKIFGSDGKPYDIIGIYPQGKKQVYRVHFVDGTFVDCCKDHLWSYNTVHRVTRGYTNFKTITTEDLYSGKVVNLIGKNGSRNVFIPVNKAVDFEKKDLPIKPYVMGLLLGDGYFGDDSSSVTFSNAEADVIEKLKEGLKDLVDVHFGGKNVYRYSLVKKQGDKFNKLKQILKELDLWKCRSLDKFIPRIYLESSIEDRQELLAGLLDTDGSISGRGASNFSTTSIKLVNDFIELVRSLGYRTTLKSYKREDKNTEYIIHIKSKDFLASSKKHYNRYRERVVKFKTTKHFDRLYIDYIEKLNEEKDMQCISVNSPDCTYICKDYIVTHNTFLLCIIAANLIKAGYKVLFLTKEMSPHQILKRMDAIMANVSYSRLKDGQLSSSEEEVYKEFLEKEAPKYASKLSIELVVNGVAECASKIDSYKPDIVLIDGGYLMSEGKDPEDWKAVLAVFKAFKVIALNRKIPIITTTQITDKGNIAYATSLKQYCDGMWGIMQDEVQRAAKEVEIQTLKIRDGEWRPKFNMNFNFTDMKYDVIYQDFDKQNKTFKMQEPVALKKLN